MLFAKQFGRRNDGDGSNRVLGRPVIQLAPAKLACVGRIHLRYHSNRAIVCGLFHSLEKDSNRVWLSVERIYASMMVVAVSLTTPPLWLGSGHAGS